MKQFVRIPFLLLLLSFLLTGCAGTVRETGPVDQLVADQQAAMIAADADAMLETVTPDDPWYRTEMVNLVEDQKTAPVSDYSLTVKSVRQIDETTWEAVLVQQYTADNRNRKIQCTHRFVQIGNRLYDAGPAFNMDSFGSVTAYYPSGYKDMARSLAGTINDYLDEVRSQWGYDPQNGIAIKLFDDHEIFLQSIKLTLPSWVGGWHENNESIKIYAAFRDPQPYESMMVHETTHMALSELTNDNAAYWMQEGFATLLELTGIAALSSPYVQDMDALARLDGQNRLPSLSEHLATNPELLSDSLDVRGYYAYSNAMVVWLLSRCDEDDLASIFETLKAQPVIAGTAAGKIQPLNQRTGDAIAEVTGIDFEDGFEQWLADKIE